MILKALIALIDSGKWISEATWARIIGMADKETLLWIKNHAFFECKYFTREDWLGEEAADRLKIIVNDRLDDLHADGLLAVIKGLIF